MPDERSADEHLLAERLIQALNLEHLAVGELSPTAALFGHESGGLGLDSIDALEIALMVQKHYGVTLRSEDPDTIAALTSLRSLSAYVLAQRKQ